MFLNLCICQICINKIFKHFDKNIDKLTTKDKPSRAVSKNERMVLKGNFKWVKQLNVLFSGISSQRLKCANLAQTGANAYGTIGSRRVKSKNLSRFSIKVVKRYLWESVIINHGLRRFGCLEMTDESPPYSDV